MSEVAREEDEFVVARREDRNDHVALLSRWLYGEGFRPPGQLVVPWNMVHVCSCNLLDLQIL